MIAFAIFSLLAFVALWTLFFKGYHVGSFPGWLKRSVQGFIIGFFIAAIIMFSARSFETVRKLFSPEKTEHVLIVENNGYAPRTFTIYERDGWNGDWSPLYKLENFSYTPRFILQGRGRDTLRLFLDTLRIDQIFILENEDIPAAVSFKPSAYPIKIYASDFEHYKANRPINIDHAQEWTAALMGLCIILALWFVALNMQTNGFAWKLVLGIAILFSFAIVYPAYYFIRTIIQNY